MVGIYPTQSIMVIIITVRSGLFVRYQKKREMPATTRLNQSRKIIFFSPFLNAKTKTIRQEIVYAALTHAPGPAPLVICAANVIAAMTDQTSQENACGFVAPLIMLRK